MNAKIEKKKWYFIGYKNNELIINNALSIFIDAIYLTLDTRHWMLDTGLSVVIAKSFMTVNRKSIDRR
jgi:hypothetical protein